MLSLEAVLLSFPILFMFIRAWDNDLEDCIWYGRGFRWEVLCFWAVSEALPIFGV